MFRLKDASEVSSPRLGRLGAMGSMIRLSGWQVLVIGSSIVKIKQCANIFGASLINPI